MLKLLSMTAVMLLLPLMVGCGSGKKEVRDGADCETILQDWKSVDGEARLAIFREHNGVSDRIQFGRRFIDKTTDELKSVLGDPDEIDTDPPAGAEEYVYYLGTTTKETPPNDRIVLSWRIDKWGKVSNVDLPLKQK